MSGRPSSGPGFFKTRDNRAGNTHFVSFDRVRGMLKRGFDMSRAIRSPFARTVFILFVTRLYEFSHWLSHGDYETLKGRLASCHTFSDDDGTILRFGE